MNIFDDLLKSFAVQREPNEDEYLDTDGLLHCTQCHGPRQCRVKMQGREVIMPCICRCRQERYEMEERREKETQRRIYIQRLKANGIQERHLLDWTFADAEDSRFVRMAKNYVGDLEAGAGAESGAAALGRCGDREVLPGGLHCQRTP